MFCFSDEPCPKKAKALDMLFGDTFIQVQESRSTADRTREEVVRYRAEAPLALTGSAMDWWKSHEGELPFLAKLAKRYLCIPGTSVPSERVFSTAGDSVFSEEHS